MNIRAYLNKVASKLMIFTHFNPLDPTYKKEGYPFIILLFNLKLNENHA
jgi:hypothetical protein